MPLVLSELDKWMLRDWILQIVMNDRNEQHQLMNIEFLEIEVEECWFMRDYLLQQKVRKTV